MLSSCRERQGMQTHHIFIPSHHFSSLSAALHRNVNAMCVCGPSLYESPHGGSVLLRRCEYFAFTLRCTQNNMAEDKSNDSCSQYPPGSCQCAKMAREFPSAGTSVGKSANGRGAHHATVHPAAPTSALAAVRRLGGSVGELWGYRIRVTGRLRRLPTRWKTRPSRYVSRRLAWSLPRRRPRRRGPTAGSSSCDGRGGWSGG